MNKRERQMIITKTKEHGNMTILGVRMTSISNRDTKLLRESGIEIGEGLLGVKFIKTGGEDENIH